MLKARVIPTLLWKNTGLVKGVGFDSWRRVGPVLPAIKVYNARDVDELILLDIAASFDRTEPDYESIHDFADECFVPFTVGGGITTVDHISRLLHAGADKVSINTAAFEMPDLIESAARRFGSQCIVVSIDVRTVDGKWMCCSRCGSENQNRDPVIWAIECSNRGAGEILLTSIDRDGTMLGYDLDLVRAVAQSVNCPVIASGGAGNAEHMRAVIHESGASAVAAASMFHFTHQTPAEVKEYLGEAGIPVRLGLQTK